MVLAHSESQCDAIAPPVGRDRHRKSGCVLYLKQSNMYVYKGGPRRKTLPKRNLINTNIRLFTSCGLNVDVDTRIHAVNGVLDVFGGCRYSTLCLCTIFFSLLRLYFQCVFRLF